MEWQPIDTMPPGTFALLYLEYPERDQGRRHTVDQFTWRERSEQEFIGESKQDGEVVKRYRVKEWKEREWDGDGWSATHWMPLPDPPMVPK